MRTGRLLLSRDKMTRCGEAPEAGYVKRGENWQEHLLGHEAVSAKIWQISKSHTVFYCGHSSHVEIMRPLRLAYLLCREMCIA